MKIKKIDYDTFEVETLGTVKKMRAMGLFDNDIINGVAEDNETKIWQVIIATIAGVVQLKLDKGENSFSIAEYGQASMAFAVNILEAMEKMDK